MVITDPIALYRSPHTAEATGRFITRLPTQAPTPSGGLPCAQPQPPLMLEIPQRPRWLGWR